MTEEGLGALAVVVAAVADRACSRGLMGLCYQQRRLVMLMKCGMQPSFVMLGGVPHTSRCRDGTVSLRSPGAKALPQLHCMAAQQLTTGWSSE